jgi:hypothetical protein
MAEDSRVVLIVDGADPLAAAGPVGWATGQLAQALVDGGVQARIASRLEDAVGGEQLVIIAGPSAPVAKQMLAAAGASLPAVAEALAIVPGQANGQPAILACGSDERGLVYAILELADRVQCSNDPAQALAVSETIIDQPANPIRCISRYFVSDVEDKPWFYDRDAWQRYLTMLATQRFNWFHLGFGIGHNFLRDVVDAYLIFPYPFLVSVPGYDVRAAGLPDEERDRNLETLRYISHEAAARGLHFQLGIWMHGYEWIDSPEANYTIQGLNASNHAAYCRDALRKVLQECPDIAGVTFRIHGESGVPEGSYDFWRTVFDGIVQCGRKMEIDLHPKGADPAMLQVATDTGMPVLISPKFTAEHMGLPGQQSSIREMEIDYRPGSEEHLPSSLMSLSAGSLRYTRYGYADFLREDREYDVLWRMWPGTQRMLLWGDPAMAAGYGRTAHFSGCVGLDFCEPLSFKGRMGSGLPGGRLAYADASLETAGGDFEKYLYTYRLWGRLLYNPEANPESWQRFLRKEFGEAAGAVEEALASASRIMPLVTSAYHVSASNNRYWPEMYTNLPIVNAERKHPYRDTPSPRRFGTATALDPGMFSAVDEFARELVNGRRSGKYSPLQVARWFDELAAAATGSLAQAEAKVADRSAPEFRRLAIDVGIQAAMGRFFAAKLRAGLAWALYQMTGSRERLAEAVDHYRKARSAYAQAGEIAWGVYRDDITVGMESWVRGHWLDRLPAIDGDLKDMETELANPVVAPSKPSLAAVQPLEALDPAPPIVGCTHTPAASFRPGSPMRLALSVTAGANQVASVRVLYRHTNQAERYEALDMMKQGNDFLATISDGYTQSAYPLQYYFELRGRQGQAWFWPGFTHDLANQPYFLVRQAG